MPYVPSWTNIIISYRQVEELQLKSGMMTQKSSEESSKVAPARNLTEQFDAETVINEQRLNLYATHSQVEEEDEDDD